MDIISGKKTQPTVISDKKNYVFSNSNMGRCCSGSLKCPYKLSYVTHVTIRTTPDLDITVGSKTPFTVGF